MKKYIAEAFGTFVLTFLGCGTAVALQCGPDDTASIVGTAFAFGLAVIAMAYSIGGISGCHINPAITIGAFLTGRLSKKDTAGYMIGQFIGGILGALVLFLVIISTDSTVKQAGIGANGANANVINALIVEIVLTCIFVFVVLGATSKTNGATNNLAGLAIGLTLIVIHLVGIRFTGTSVNPARSFGPALFAGVEALKDLWIFIVGPFIGGALAAFAWKAINGSKE